MAADLRLELGNGDNDDDDDDDGPPCIQIDALSPATPTRRPSRQFSRATSPANPERALPEAGSEATYKWMLKLQFVMRLLDYLSINTVIPTLPGYLQQLGGGETEYYCILSSNAACMMLGSLLLGIYVDRGPGRILPAYIGTAALTIVGSVLYAMAGTVRALRSTGTLLVARCLVGLGASNSMLCLIFLGEAVRPEERQKWVIRFGITRSQGLFWGPPLGMALAAVSTGQEGVLGANALPGWFQAWATAAVLSALAFTWQELPERPAAAPEAYRSNGSTLSSGRVSLGAFLAQGRVLAVLTGMFLIGVSQVCCEVVVPVLTGAALGWTGAERGLPLTAMALTLTLGQLSLLQLTKLGVEDRSIQFAGVFTFAAVLLVALGLWGSSEGPGGRWWEAEVLGPFVVSAFCAPYAMLGSFSTFARLSFEDAPHHKGKCQAIQNNLLAASNILGPLLLSWTYSGMRAREELVPRTGFELLAVVDLAALLALASAYRSLRPVPGAREAAGGGSQAAGNGRAALRAPLLKQGSGAASGGS